MMKLERSPAPGFLRENYKKWGREFAQKRAEHPNYRFQWKRYAGEPVNALLKAALNRDARKHCAFCDSYPLGVAAQQTIEHFRPKSRYPRLCYAWPNLFLCCNVCQNAKRERFDKRLLKPDKRDYRFERYFIINYKTGELQPNPRASVEDQQRAELTIESYGLNREGRPQSRWMEYQKYQDLAGQNYELADFSYRFFLE